MNFRALFTTACLTLGIGGMSAIAYGAPRRFTQPIPGPQIISQALPDTPTASQLTAYSGFPEPLLPVGKIAQNDSQQQLAESLKAWSQRTSSDDTRELRRFVAKFPSSEWSPALHLNLGHISYQAGRFSDALSDWLLAWETAKDLPGANAELIANSGLAFHCSLLSRLGRTTDLDSKLKLGQERQFRGTALQRFSGALENARIMREQPGISFRCGPFALASVQEALSKKPAASFLKEIQSPIGGFAISEVVNMAKIEGLEMLAIRRIADAKIPVPCVVHWKLDHYAAIVAEKDGRFLLKDPTFGYENWVSKETLDQESSGAFVIERKSPLPNGWVEISLEEQKGIHGKGYVACAADGGFGNSLNTASTTRSTDQCESSGGITPGGQTGGCVGMAGYSFLPIPCSLLIRDTPLLYMPAWGPAIPFQLAYHQRTVDQPNTLIHSNFGPLWASEFISYLEDTPENPSALVILHLRNGGYIKFTPNVGGNYSTDTGSGSTLVSVGPGQYERRFKDGSKESYTQAIGSTGPNRKVFLTKITDSQGFELNLIYDTAPGFPTRLKTIVDATGLATELSYTEFDFPYLISSVSDPFGREAHFHYGQISGSKRLTSITDVVGLTSSFQYDANGTIQALITPYGITKFSTNSPIDPANATRFVEATAPNGLKERIEFIFTSGFSYYGQPDFEASPAGVPNNYLQYRNVYYWDRKAMRALGGDVSANLPASLANATIMHMLHVGNSASGVIESIRRPLQSRVFYLYPGQFDATYVGSSTVWSQEARLVENENGVTVTQKTQREVNSQNKVTKIIDPLGRETVYEYDINGIDLRFTKQKIGVVLTTIQEIQYNPAFPPHLPWKITDAAGQTTTYQYNARGQVTSITNPLSETSTFVYEENTNASDYGKLKSITGAAPGATTTYTYDASQRVRTVTDSAGYVLTYDYDNLDRVTRITYPDGTYEETTHDRLDVGKKRDRMGRVTETKYNSLRQPVLTVDAAQRVLQYDYCSCGSMKLLIDGNGNQTKWDYDVLGRVISKRYADNRGNDYAYEPLSGRLATITDAKRQIKKYSYNVDGTLQKLDYQNEEIATPDVTYAYDPDFNRLSTMLDGIGTHTYQYYPPGVLGALQVHTNDGPFVDPVLLTDLITYTYDELGRVKTRNIGPTGTENKITWSYDSLGRVISEVNNLCPQTPTPTQFTYNYVGTTKRLTSVDYPNGQRTLYDYWPAATNSQPGNGDFRLKQIANLGQGTDPATLLSRFDYTYDPVGNILTWGRKLGAAAMEETYTLGYDAADQLTRGILHETANPNNILYRYYVTFDKAGNRRSKQENDTVTSYAYNNLNQLVSNVGGGLLRVVGHTDEAASVTINGVRAKLLSGRNFEATVPVIVGTNQLTLAATDTAHPANTRIKQWNVYVGNVPPNTSTFDFNGNTTNDGQGAMTWDAENRMVNHHSLPVGHKYVFDGFSRRLAQLDGNGQRVNRWIWCDSTPCEWRTSAGTFARYSRGQTFGGSRYLSTLDHLGSIRELSLDAGLLVRRWDYSINGEQTAMLQDPSVPLVAPFGFTGHFQDSPSHFITHYRSYNSISTRWQSRDPIYESDDLNLYLYVRNNSVKFIDPRGLKVWICKERDWVIPHAWYCVTDSAGVTQCYDQNTAGIGLVTPGRNSGIAYKPDPSVCQEIPTTPEQDECLKTAGEAERPNYSLGNLFGKNCTRWRNSALSSCGVKLSFGFTTPTDK